MVATFGSVFEQSKMSFICSWTCNNNIIPPRNRFLILRSDTVTMSYKVTLKILTKIINKLLKLLNGLKYMRRHNNLVTILRLARIAVKHQRIFVTQSHLNTGRRENLRKSPKSEKPLVVCKTIDKRPIAFTEYFKKIQNKCLSLRLND